jgi:hypothetical protein
MIQINSRGIKKSMARYKYFFRYTSCQLSHHEIILSQANKIKSMRKQSLESLVIRIRICIVLFIAAIACLLLFSFAAKKTADNFLQQLGIAKADADKKIINSIMGGYLDAYGVKNAGNIALGNRAALAKDLLRYTKEQVGSGAFKKEYAALKENNRPTKQYLQTPEEMKNSMIDTYRKNIAETEASLKKADAGMKSIFENVLAASKEELKKLMDPKNQLFTEYAANYPMMIKQFEESYQQQLNEWEATYPANQLLFVKMRLQQFMDETSNIDYNAALTIKNNRQVFVTPSYEHKSNRWKMAFRAGREVVETAREFIGKWMEEIR